MGDESVITDYSTTDEMDNLLIPPFFQHNLIHGRPPPAIQKLRPWQIELLQKEEWTQRKSCVCVAPTSGGKTLIAEIAIAQLLDDNPHAKIIYALPFVALASEKYVDLEKRFQKYTVRPFFQNIGGNDFRNGSIAVCTYEKAHSILNQSVKNDYFSDIKLVIVDEAHMIGDESRGVVAEALIMKLKTFKEQPQIIALTATLNEEDAMKLASSINGYAFLSSERVTPLKTFIARKNGELYKIEQNSSKVITKLKLYDNDPDLVLPLVLPLFNSPRPQSVLVFVNTRNDTRRVAQLLLVNTQKSDNEALQSIMQELSRCPGGSDPLLMECVSHGIAFHHAGLMMEERKAVERGAKEGSIKIIVATTTLSAGINIRSVSRVVILAPYRYNTELKKKELMPSSTFAQMSGRAGRTDQIAGEVVAVVDNNKEFEEVCLMMQKPLPNIQVSHGESVFSYMLQSLSLGLAKTSDDLEKFANSPFINRLKVMTSQDIFSSPSASQEKISPPRMQLKSPKPEGVSIDVVGKGINKLRELGLVDHDNLNTTKLGSALTTANIPLEEGVEMSELIRSMMKSFCMTDELQILSVCVPRDCQIKIPKLSDPLFEMIFNMHEKCISIMTQKSRMEIEHLIVQVCTGYPLSKDDEVMFRRIFIASILFDIINEKGFTDISEKYGIDRGTVQSLQSGAASRAGQAARFADSMGYSVLAAQLTNIKKRLSFCVKSELLDLVSIPGIKAAIARCLYDRGITNAEQLSQTTISDFKDIISTITDESEANQLSKRVINHAKRYVEHLSILQEFEDDVMAKMSNAI